VIIRFFGNSVAKQSFHSASIFFKQSDS